MILYDAYAWCRWISGQKYAFQSFQILGFFWSLPSLEKTNMTVENQNVENRRYIFKWLRFHWFMLVF